MIVPDVNLLLYAYFTDFPMHEVARPWWEARLSEASGIGLCAPAVLGFVRIATNRRVFRNAMDLDGALGITESWLSRPAVRFLAPGPDHLASVSRLLRAAGTSKDLTTDAQIAALALQAGGTVASSDGDFARFPGVRWTNPLTS